jgi:hypothetical protein
MKENKRHVDKMQTIQVSINIGGIAGDCLGTAH